MSDIEPSTAVPDATITSEEMAIRGRLLLAVVALAELACGGTGTTLAPAPRPAPKALPAPSRQPPAEDPRVTRERALLAAHEAPAIRALPAEERAARGAEVHREIADLREARGDPAGAEHAIERALREAYASRSPELHRRIAADRFRILRGHARTALDRGDVDACAQRLDHLSLSAETTPEERRLIAGDRFLLNEMRSAREGAPEQAFDASLVLAEVERLFGAGAAEATGGGEETFLERLAFELRATEDAVGLSLVGAASSDLDPAGPPATAADLARPPASMTRGHDLGTHDKVTVDLGTRERAPLAIEAAGTKEEAKVGPRIDTVALVETGRFDPRTVAALVSLNKRAVGRCYERSLHAGERLEGKLEIHLSVQPAGTVGSARIVSEGHAATELGRCVISTITRWRFPPFAGAEPALVTIPFVLKSRL